MRKKLGLSQQDFAVKVGYSSGAMISKIEAGQRTPHWDYLQKMAEMAGLTIDYFFPNGTPEVPNDQQEAFIAFRKFQELVLKDDLPDLADYLRLRYGYDSKTIEQFVSLQQKIGS